MNRILLLAMALILVACGLDSPQEKKTIGKDGKTASAVGAPAPAAETVPAPEIVSAPIPEAVAATSPVVALPPVAPAATTLAIRIANGEYDGPLGVKKLIRERAYSNETESELTHVDQMGRVPLHYAKDPTLVSYLWDLKYGSRGKPAYLIPDKHHQIPLHVYADEGFLAGVEFYLTKLCRPTHNPFYEGWEAVFGSWLNALDDANRTALHLAVITNQKETVRALLRCESIDLEPEDVDGRFPLHYAAEQDDFANGFAILKTADERPVSLHFMKPDKRGETVIDIARRGKSPDALTVLEAAALGHKLPRSN